MSDREKLQKQKFLTALIVLFGIFLTYIGTEHGNDFLFYSGLISFLGAIIYLIFSFRCPHCKEILNARGPIPNYCPHCGKEIN